MSPFLKCVATGIMGSLLLAGCGVSYTSYSYIEKHTPITGAALADGTSVQIGMTEPQNSWNCSAVDSQGFNWSLLQVKNQVSFSPYQGAVDDLKKHALDYANAKALKTNYIALSLPSQLEIDNINTNVMSDATARYYECKNLPLLPENSGK